MNAGDIPQAAIFDLDGTLTESKQPLDPDMGALLAQLLQRMPVAVMSGGSFAQFQKQFLPGLPESVTDGRLYIFPTSAAQCFLLLRREWHKQYECLFSTDEKKHIREALDTALAETGLASPPERVWGERIEDRGAQITFSALGQEAPIQIKKDWDPTRQKRLPLWQRLTELLPECTIALNATTSIDITKKGITKAYGLRKLAEMTGIPITGMLYVGDALWEGGNDSIVKETGIRTLQISEPDETWRVIISLLQ